MSLRLKFEAQTSLINTSKTSSEELSNRCDELQRELLRCKLALQDSKNTIEVLERDLRESDDAIKSSQVKIVKLEESIHSSTEMHTIQLESTRKMMNTEISNLKGDLHNSRIALEDAQRVINNLQQDKISSDSAAKHLDEYKKKAQAALKKV